MRLPGRHEAWSPCSGLWGSAYRVPVPSSRDTGSAQVIDRSDSWAVLGSGPFGLAAVKAFALGGLSVIGYDRGSDVGGGWNRATPWSIGDLPVAAAGIGFPDFPVPADYPDYPSREQVRAYLRRYAAHFGLYDRIRFGSEVLSVARTPGEAQTLDVRVRDLLTDEVLTHRHAGVVVATGGSGIPVRPTYPGLERFAGPVVHAAELTETDDLIGRRVLVVGDGALGAAAAVALADRVAATLYSTSVGYRCLPRYLMGLPLEQWDNLLLALRAPVWMRRHMMDLVARMVPGNLARFGVERPTPWASPILGSSLPDALAEGRVRSRPDIARIGEDTVEFVDGRRDEVDVIVWGTGSRPDLGYLDDDLVPVVDGSPALDHHFFSPRHPALLLPGMIETDSGRGDVAHWQAMVAAEYARVRRDNPSAASDFRMSLRWESAQQPADEVGHPERRAQVEHHDYLRRLAADLHGLEVAA